METTKRKSTAPFYAAAVVWLAYALVFPLYEPLHYALAAGAAILAFLAATALCRAENIADPGISADIVRLEQVSAKIFEEVKAHPEKLPQIRRFLDYYLPTTLKLLNAYDRMSGTGVSGENIDTTLAKVEGMMRTITAAFEKQLDSLYGAEALDISTDITVLENMMAREGLTEDPLKAETKKTEEDGNGIQLEL